MKKTIKILFILMAMCLLLGACAQTAEPEINDEVQQMKYYFDTYGDTYATIILRYMYEAGDITDDDYSGDIAARGNSFDDAALAEYDELSLFMSGQLESLTCEDFSIRISLLMEDLYDYGVSVSLFRDQETRDRFESAVRAVDAWLAQPDDEHTKAMEAMITQDDITPGEIVYLYYDLFNNAGRLSGPIEVDGQTYDFFSYADARIIDEKTGMTLLMIQEEAAAKLREMNRCAIEE